MGIYPEIKAGEAVAIKLREVFYKDVPMSPKIACDIGFRLAKLKILAKPYYPELDMVGLLNKLADYSHKDIAEAFDLDIATEGKQCSAGNRPKPIGTILTSFMET